MNKRYALACPHSLAHHRLVVLNVSLAVNAHRTKHVSIKDVSTHAQELAVQMLNVTYGIIAHYAPVAKDTLAMLSPDAIQFLVRQNLTRQ